MKIEAINKEPVLIDFNSADKDGATWLWLPFRSAISSKEILLSPHENAIIWVTDGEIEEFGKMTYREGRWVLFPLTPLREVSKTAPYHTLNFRK